MIDGICGRQTVSDCFSLSPCRRHLDNVLQCAVLITSCTSQSSIIFRPRPCQIMRSECFLLTHAHTRASMAFNPCSETSSKPARHWWILFHRERPSHSSPLWFYAAFCELGRQVILSTVVKQCKQMMGITGTTIRTGRFHARGLLWIWLKLTICDPACEKQAQNLTWLYSVKI